MVNEVRVLIVMNPNDANPNLQCHTSSDVIFLHKSLGSSFTYVQYRSPITNTKHQSPITPCIQCDHPSASEKLQQRPSNHFRTSHHLYHLLLTSPSKPHRSIKAEHAHKRTSFPSCPDGNTVHVIRDEPSRF